MSLWAAFFLLAAIWCTIHGLYFLLHSKIQSLLPTQSHLSDNPPRRLFNLSKTPHVHVTLKGLHLQLSTTRWNAEHDKLISFLSRRSHRTLAGCVRWVYNLGVLLGGVGMLVAVVALCCMCITSAYILFQKLVQSVEDPAIQHLAKRSEESVSKPGAGFPAVTAIIPGVTVPLNHLPVIIAAVFISQVIHELGHALAAAMEALPMTTCGVSFTVVIPAAFVSFPTPSMHALPPKARARIIAAGPYHNLVFWAFLAVAARAGVVHLASIVSGYRDVASLGKVVVHVNPDSPLSLHLRPGSIITQLDDTPLEHRDMSTDIWSEYLQGTVEHSSLGWCVLKTVLAKTDECCHTKKLSSFSCFVTGDNAVRGCIDPVPVLASPQSHDDSKRCSSGAGCTPDAACVVPAEGVQLLRLTVRTSISDTKDPTTVLWSGPPTEIWEEVQVSNWLPRIWFLPLWIPPLVATFYEYLTMATLSLFFFNLLPAPRLDGTQLLRALLDLALDVEQGASAYDFGAMEAGDIRSEWEEQRGRGRRRWKERLMRFVPYTTVCIGMWGFLLSVVNVIY